jgi:2,4-dichlorophenol 6-monooxygenase
LRRAISLKSYEFATLGVELNPRYVSSAVVSESLAELAPRPDPELHYQPSVQPGARLPHAWLNRNGEEISTLDLVGKGRFTILTGIGGGAWINAARGVEQHFGVQIVCITIGPGHDVQDLYGTWSELHDGPECDCILVRPDAYIAWRGRLETLAEDSLHYVFSKILGAH